MKFLCALYNQGQVVSSWRGRGFKPCYLQTFLSKATQKLVCFSPLRKSCFNINEHSLGTKNLSYQCTTDDSLLLSDGGVVRGVSNLWSAVNHIAIVVSDVGRSLAFYTDIVGMKQVIRPNFDRYLTFLMKLLRIMRVLTTKT